MNKVILIGNLAADPEIRSTQSGMKVATYRLAVNRRKKQDGTQEADFFTCVAWDKAADFVQRYLTKGRKIAIEGRLQSRSYDAQDGSKRHVVEIMVESHDFCDINPSGAQAPQTAPAPNGGIGGGFTEIQDDDLPF